MLVVAEHDNATLNPCTLSALAASAVLEAQTTVLVAGHGCRSVAEQVARYSGVDAVWCADHPDYAHALPESIGALVSECAPQFSQVLATASTWSKAWMPRVGALLGVAPFSDVVGIQGPKEWVRPTYAGNALETLVSQDTLQLCTVRAAAFPGQEVAYREEPAAIQSIDTVCTARGVRFVRRAAAAPSDRPNLLTARVVMAGGRGLPSAEYFAMLSRIAVYFNAAVGASRAAVDAGLAPNDGQIGQTGKIIAPELYIAVGISGAIQHKAGIVDSGIIVAINKDPEAPIFEVADYGLVGDLTQILPDWLQRLEGN